MTIGDINIYINDYNDKQKDMLRDRYETSKLISYFVNLGLNGKDIPDITDVYEGIFDVDIDLATLEALNLKQFLMLAKMINILRAHSNGR